MPRRRSSDWTVVRTGVLSLSLSSGSHGAEKGAAGSQPWPAPPQPRRLRRAHSAASIVKVSHVVASSWRGKKYPELEKEGRGDTGASGQDSVYLGFCLTTSVSRENSPNEPPAPQNQIFKNLCTNKISVSNHLK